MNKILIIGAGVAGYVLGTRSGRGRYEQIKHQSSKVWNSGPVQRGVSEAENAARSAASAAGDKVTGGAS